MRQVFAVALILAAMWGGYRLLPPSNDEAELRSLTGIAAEGATTALTSTKATPNAAPISGAYPESSAEAVLPLPASAQSELGSTLDRTELIGLLQAQLRRVGCYKGTVNRHWDAATQRAMARFDEHIGVHADLDQPPAALLPVIQQFGDRACGPACPAGARPNDEGYCLAPQTVATSMTVPSPDVATTRKPAEPPSRLASLGMATSTATTNVANGSAVPTGSAAAPTMTSSNSPLAWTQPAAATATASAPGAAAASSPATAVDQPLPFGAPGVLDGSAKAQVIAGMPTPQLRPTAPAAHTAIAGYTSYKHRHSHRQYAYNGDNYMPPPPPRHKRSGLQIFLSFLGLGRGVGSL